MFDRGFSYETMSTDKNFNLCHIIMSGQTSAYHYISGNAPHPDRPTVRRQNVLAILYSPSDDQFALLDREGYGRKSRIMGGTDGEDLITAGQREIAEESGYIDLEYEKTLE